MENWNGYQILDKEHVPDLERQVMDKEAEGIDHASAMSLVYDAYKRRRMTDGAVFHLRGVQTFKNTEHQDAYNAHLAMVALYKLKGFDFSTKQAQSLDRELREPDPELVKHPSDAYVLKLGIN